ncbi:MAG TPA: hypothetical protein VME01_09450, partial [Solirubrobacteraceae bacterium]|nr:hypothetical protein [Solirubrobacteraceae bacterium]
MYFLFKYLMRVWRQRQAQRAAAEGGTPLAGAEAARQPAPVTAAGPSGAPRADGPSAASRGPLAVLAHQARYDLKTSLRNPRARFMG